MKFIILLLIVNFQQIASAEVYKCINSAGKITYSESTCPKNTNGGELIIEPNVIDSSYIRNKIQSDKLQKLNSTKTETTFTTESSIDSNGGYMPSHEKETRLRHLRIDMSDGNSYEKISDAKTETAVLNRRPPKSLSYDLEQKRRNLKIDLSASEYSKRRTALSRLNSIYTYY